MSLIKDSGVMPRQLNKQPIIRAPLKEKKKQLSPGDTLRTAFIAAGRGDNERMVGRPFYFRLIYYGFKTNCRMDLVNYHWLNCNAMTNFLFRPLTLSTRVNVTPEIEYREISRRQ